MCLGILVMINGTEDCVRYGEEKSSNWELVSSSSLAVAVVPGRRISAKNIMSSLATTLLHKHRAPVPQVSYIYEKTTMQCLHSFASHRVSQNVPTSKGSRMTINSQPTMISSHFPSSIVQAAFKIFPTPTLSTAPSSANLLTSITLKAQ